MIMVMFYPKFDMLLMKCMCFPDEYTSFYLRPIYLIVQIILFIWSLHTSLIGVDDLIVHFVQPKLFVTPRL